MDGINQHPIVQARNHTLRLSPKDCACYYQIFQDCAAWGVKMTAFRWKNSQQINILNCVSKSIKNYVLSYKYVKPEVFENRDLIKLASTFRGLKKLKIDAPGKINFVGLAALVSFCPKLEKIEFSECGYFGDQALALLTISELPLKKVSFIGCAEIHENVETEFRKKHPNTVLTLSGHGTLFNTYRT